MPFLCLCVCVLCNVYWCELMLDSKRYWMQKKIGRNPNNIVKPKKREKNPLKFTEDKQSVMK